MRIGILIIGSLIWDMEKQRPSWRSDRLCLEESIVVKAPIRYGRKSDGRNGTYTMILSRKAPLGDALVLSCRTGDLIDEAVHLWRAESGIQDSNRISAGWGCVALLLRDAQTVSEELKAKWLAKVARESGYGERILPAHGEEPLISKTGMLLIDWPVRSDNNQELDFDALLATTNEPSLTGTPPDYPTPVQIAAEWRRSPTNRDYFDNNRTRGIKTFEDDGILTALNAT